LARDCGVPIVPVAVLGTADVLPKGASFISPAPMQVRIGEPVDPNSASGLQLRAEVMALREGSRPEILHQVRAAA
jgi:1-acyl-sn-glycerol-3-phosphate acyltransferase